MTMNKLTSGSNIYRELSRKFLSEHREKLIHERVQLIKQTRPELTEEEQEEMFGRLQASRSNSLEVTVTLMGQFENKMITGIVTGLDPRLHLLKMDVGNDWQLIDFADVIGVELNADGY